jgi:hypothetical protein
MSLRASDDRVRRSNLYGVNAQEGLLLSRHSRRKRPCTAGAAAAFTPLRLGPWYVGYKNKVEKSRTKVMASVRRYGPEGVVKLSNYIPNPEPVDVKNMWAPALRSAATDSNTCGTSPKAWPKQALYPHGSTPKTRECAGTTGTRTDEPVSLPRRLQQMSVKEGRNMEVLHETVRAAKRLEWSNQARPRTCPVGIGAEGRRRAVSRSDGTMTFCTSEGNMTVIVRRKNNKAAGIAELQQFRDSDEEQGARKWALISKLAKSCISLSCGALAGINCFAQALSVASASGSDDPEKVSRWISLKQFKMGCWSQQISLRDEEVQELFAAFQTRGCPTGTMNWVQLIASTRIATPVQWESTLQAAYDVYSEWAKGGVTLHRTLEILLLPAATDRERHEIETAWRHRFQNHFATLSPEARKRSAKGGPISADEFDMTLERCPGLLETFEKLLARRTRPTVSREREDNIQ